MQLGFRFSLVVALLIGQSVPAQLLWRPVTLNSRSQHAMVTDQIRQRVVLFGGTVLNDTWEWDGVQWLLRRPAHRPPVRQFSAMAYDLFRARTVLFGGGSINNDTWEWDGTDWQQLTPPVSPKGHMGHRMAYDPGRRRVVLFGGVGNGGRPAFQDTWEWDGTTWQQIVPLVSPSPRALHSLAFDPVLGKVLLFGGTPDIFGLQSPFGDTWTWDGTSWNQLSPANSPTARCTAMSTDNVRGRVVLYAGAPTIYSIPTVADTWEWDGANWNQINAVANPGLRVGHAMAFDASGRTILFGMEYLTDSWAWDGVNWTQVATTVGPSARTDHALAYDPIRDRVVLFGGMSAEQHELSDTWLWDGTAWSQASSVTSPSPRSRHVMTFDPVRQRVVLFGGTGLNDTWEWDGTSWVMRSPTAPPPPQVRPAMVWDGARQRVFLYGSDNYEWDGSQWTQRPSAVRPFSTHDHCMAFDPLRNRVLLFGGSYLAETLEWDGTNWRSVPMGPSVPPARRAGTMVFDAALARVLMFGGDNSVTGLLDDVWEWDGSVWANRSPATNTGVPIQRLSHAMVHDARRQRNLMFGGGIEDKFDDTWELSADWPASYVPYGSGCAGSAGMPVLAAAAWQLPWLNQSFTAEVKPVPAVAAGVMLTGYSRTSWLGIPLPLSLAAAGMPGCYLQTSGQLILALSVGGYVGSLSLPLPADPALVGAAFFQQAVLTDFGANPAGVIVSNGAEGRFGQR